MSTVEEKKTVITVTADTSQARTELDKLAATTSKNSTEAKKLAQDAALLGNKWDELSKSMVGLQLHDAFTKVSAGAKEASGGVIDLNMAFAGYKVAGPWGAAIGAVGGAVVKAAGDFGVLQDGIDDLERKALEATRHWIPGMTEAVWDHADALDAEYQRLLRLPTALGDVQIAFAKQAEIVKKAKEFLDGYNSTAAQIGRGLGAASQATPGVVGDFFGKMLGYDEWNPDKTKKKLAGIFNPQKGEETDAQRKARLRRQLGGQGEENVPTFRGVYGNGYTPGIKAEEDRDEYGNAANTLQNQVTAMGDALDKERNTRESRYGEFNKGKEGSFLESTFGKIEEFNGYATAFNMLSGAVGASLSAWIDGSASAGDAFKKFIGEALKGLAVQMAMESLKHGAYAIGSLAFGDVRGAAQHGQAAALFAVGAAAAAVAAKSMHVSAPTPGGGGARPGAPNVGGGGGGGQPQGPIIVYSDSFAEGNARSKQLEAERMVQRAIGSQAVQRS